MSIADQIDNLNPFTTKRQRHQAEVASTHDKLVTVRGVVADLATKFSETNRALEVAEKSRANLALKAMLGEQGADQAYAKANLEVEKLTGEIKKISAAQVAATEAVKQAESDLRKIAHGDRVAEQKRLGNQRLKCAQEIVELVAALHAAHTKLVEVGVKAQMCWPNGFPPQHGLLHEKEVFDHLTWEFARVSGRNPLPKRGDAPQLPGAAYPWEVNHERTKIKPLTDAVSAATEFLLAELNKLPLPSGEPAPVVDEIVSDHRKPASQAPAPITDGIVVAPSRKTAPIAPSAALPQQNEYADLGITSAPSRKGSPS